MKLIVERRLLSNYGEGRLYFLAINGSDLAADPRLGDDREGLRFVHRRFGHRVFPAIPSDGSETLFKTCFLVCCQKMGRIVHYMFVTNGIC